MFNRPPIFGGEPFVCRTSSDSPGVLFLSGDAANGPALAPLRDALQAERQLVVGDNQPYAVSDTTDYSIPVHGEARDLPNTGIEIRQDLIAHEEGQQEWARRLELVLRAAQGLAA